MGNKKGFTLIEVMIVVIILGVLAAVALPRLSNQVEVSKAAEATQVLGALMRKVQECYTLASEQIGLCDTTGELSGFSFPTSTNFTYNFPQGACGSTSCAGRALNTKLGGTNTITYTLNASTGAVTKTYAGMYLSISKN
jgi:prepilin-type N-terminal cleavage/methylation domain-containing protein